MNLLFHWDRVKRQAKKFNHSIRREYCYLFTHGLVHLQGFDLLSRKRKNRNE
ncbi:rRNA maturation RNAse YbeY [Mycoplasmopsis cynos]|nr:rRNA maturation RNAse YbeY [Mycoplasmopsis cynos]